MKPTDLGRRFFGICAAVAHDRPWTILAVSLLLTVVAAYAATRLTVSTRDEDIISPESRFVEIARAYAQVFPERKGEAMIAVIDAPTAQRAQETAMLLAARLRERTDAVRNVEVPGAEPFFQNNALFFLSVEQLEQLVARLRQAQPMLEPLAADSSLRGLAAVLERLRAASSAGRSVPSEAVELIDRMAATVAARAENRAATLSWSSALGLEIDRQSNRRLLLVEPVLDQESLAPAQPALDAIRTAFDGIARADADRSVGMRITGLPALRQQELNLALSGALYASILSFILVALTLVIGIRSWRLILILVVTLLIGTVWTSGLAALVGELNLISLAFGVLFFGLGVDFGTHLGLRYMERIAGAGSRSAITSAVVGEGPALTLSVVCASIGFLSFLPTKYLGLGELGIISSLGMLVAFVITVVLMPAMLALLPPRAKPASGGSTWFSRFVERRAGSMLVVAAVVTAGAALLATQAQIDVNPLNLQDPDTEPVQTYRDLASDPETSPYALNVAAPSLEAARDLAARLREVRGVAAAQTVDRLVPDQQDDKRNILVALSRGLAARARSPQAGALDDAGLRNAFARLQGAATRLAGAAPGEQIATSARQLATALESFGRTHGTEPAPLRARPRFDRRA